MFQIIAIVIFYFRSSLGVKLKTTESNLTRNKYAGQKSQDLAFPCVLCGFVGAAGLPATNLR